MITHDLGVVAGICDNVLVMYAGRTMEYGTAEQIFYTPSHPYSIGLIGAVPRVDGQEEELITIPGNPPNLLRLPVAVLSNHVAFMQLNNASKHRR